MDKRTNFPTDDPQSAEIRQALADLDDAERETAAIDRVRAALDRTLRADHPSADQSERSRPTRRFGRLSGKPVIALATCAVLTSGVVAVAAPELAGSVRDQAAQMLGVFDEAKDAEPSQVSSERSDDLRKTERPDGISPDSQAGKPLPSSEGRVLLTHREGSLTVEIFAVPTTTGGICYTVTLTRPGRHPGGASECIRELPDTWPIDASGSLESGEAPIRFGVVSEDVVAVRVHSPRGVTNAIVDNGGYLWIGRDPEDRPFKFDLILRDGRRLSGPSDAVPPSASGSAPGRPTGRPAEFDSDMVRPPKQGAAPMPQPAPQTGPIPVR